MAETISKILLHPLRKYINWLKISVKREEGKEKDLPKSEIRAGVYLSLKSKF